MQSDLPTEPDLPPDPYTLRRAARPSRWAGRALLALIGSWTFVVAFAAQGTAYVVSVQERGDPWLPWVALTLIQVAATGILVVPLALRRTGESRYNAAYRAWMWALGYLLLMAGTRALPPVRGDELLLLQLALTLIYAYFVRFRAPRSAPASRAGLALSVAVAALFAMSWIALGSLGSIFDTLLALALGFAFGQVASGILARTWHTSLAHTGLLHDSRGFGRDLLTGGYVAGIMLLILASGLSFNGAHLAYMLALPALGWAVVLAGSTRGDSAPSPQASAALVGLTAAILLAFVDPDAANPIAADPLLLAMFVAAGAAVLVGWFVALLGLLARNVLPHLRAAPTTAVALILVALAALIFVMTGRTRLYGDTLFVILREQTDVTSASGMADYDERRAYVYRTLAEHAATTQADLRRSLDRFNVPYTPYYLVNALEVRGDLPLRLWLATRPEVDRVLPTPTLRPTPSKLQIARGQFSLPGTTPAWNLTLIGADRVWEQFGVRGEGIVIGHSDSGAQYLHSELRQGYRAMQTGLDHNYNWYDPWYGSEAPVDHSGHGTHTLGSILGQRTGVAPGASWFACANLVRNLGNPAKYLDCLQFMLAPFPLDGDPFADGDPTRSAHVLNNSWGCPYYAEGCDADSLWPAVVALRAAGIFIVASAGNSGPECSTITDPIATYDAVFTVGAVDRNGNLAAFSSAGPVKTGPEVTDSSLLVKPNLVKPDLVAPGVDVLSAYPNSYSIASGTSMAGPHVAGVVALIWSANPDLIGDIERTEEILIATARPFTGSLVVPSTPVLDNQPANPIFPPDDVPIGIVDDSNEDACINQVRASGESLNSVAGYGIVDAYAAVEEALRR